MSAEGGTRRIGRVLVANRGEIAVRIIRTCRELGVETVLAASEADRDAMAARLADRTVCIGPARPELSYLSIPAIVTAAVGTGCDAIHPGYGFLAENAELARTCEQEGIIFIGPTAEQIARVGDKLEARAAALAAEVPVTPGGRVENAEEALALAGELGYPLLVKAVGGGGGRGMKRVDDADAMREMLALATAEAQTAFGDGRVYLERYVTNGRHVEVQVLGDGERVIHLGDRDCSVQRRYQKLIEEAPAPAIAPALRAALRAAAVRFAGHLGYRGLGTVEFLLDCERDTFYFLEMNARIQVEHPVTEMVTGIDLVAQQIAVAEGRPLPFGQDDIRLDGHAIECRLNAEDPAHDFRPSPGRVSRAEFPAGAGLRIDTHIEAGAMVPPFYDSMIAKVIAHGHDRDAAIAALGEALRACHIDGVATNRDLHLAVLADAGFRRGGVDTGYLGRFLAAPAAVGGG